MDAQHFNILRIITKNRPASYKELMSKTGLSRYLINKYVEEINLYLKTSKMDTSIDFTPRIGFSIKDSTKIRELLNGFKETSDLTKNKRIVQLLSMLLDVEGSITIQELADRMYISRATLEKTLKDVRIILKEYNLSIVGTKTGIFLDLNEEDKRQFLSKLISTYKSKLVAGSNYKQELRITLKFPEDIKEFIDLTTINKAADIVGSFIDKTNLYLTEYEYNSLVIHIGIAIDRLQKNFIVNHATPNYEFEKNTEYLITKIEHVFQIKLPEFEKNHIDIHVKSIQQNIFNKNEYGCDQRFNDDDQGFVNFRNKVKKILLNLKPDEELIEDLTLHLKSAVNRLENNVSIRNPYLEQIKSNFISAFENSKKLVLGLEEEFNIEFDEDETAYIAVHIQSFFERMKKNDVTDIVLVCSSGYGTSKLLEQRMKNYFGDSINIIETIGMNQLNNMNLKNELVVTTVPITDSSINSVYVNPLLTKEDIDTIDKHINNKNNSSSFLELISESYFRKDNKRISQKEAIRKMVDHLSKNDIVEPQIFESILEREELSSTSIGNLAMPHGGIEYIKKPLIYIYQYGRYYMGKRKGTNRFSVFVKPNK